MGHMALRGQPGRLLVVYEYLLWIIVSTSSATRRFDEGPLSPVKNKM